jgi:hypothetical protein
MALLAIGPPREDIRGYGGFVPGSQEAWLTDDMLNASTRSGGMAARLK